MADITKINAYAVIGLNHAEISKINAYVVRDQLLNSNITKINAYLVRSDETLVPTTASSNMFLFF